MLQVAAEQVGVALAHVLDELLAAHVGARRHAVHAAARPVQRVRAHVPPHVDFVTELLLAHGAFVGCEVKANMRKTER